MKESYRIFTDERGGDLIPVEFSSVKFVPKRIFTVSDVPKNSIRGQHAHFNTVQFLICVRGEVMVSLHDGIEEKQLFLKKGEAVYIEKMIWDYQKFLTGNDLIVVLCSTSYDKSDYIENFDEFVRLSGKKSE